MNKAWKACKALALAALSAWVVSLLGVIAVGQWQPDIAKADAAIILGAAINTPALYNRSLHGLDLFQRGKVPLLVLSGGRISDRDISEAQYMEKVIAANGEAMPLMALEEYSHSTYENIINSKKLIPEATSVVVVSDTYHLARGAAMAKAAGFATVYWSSPKTSSYYPPGQLLYHYLRESVAMISYIPKFISAMR